MDNQNELQRVLNHLKDSHPEFARDLADASCDPPTIAGFLVIRKIGEGGFGDVWLAQNQIDRSFVALKTFRDVESTELDGICEYKQRVNDHPHLVQIDHVGKSGEHLYYVMQLADSLSNSSPISGPETYEPATLAEYIARTGKLSTAEAMEVAKQILSALERLHEGGAIHRDVKPSNILRFGGVWKLGDPGLVVATNANNAPAGTKAYQCEGAQNGPAVDLHALSVTMTEITDNDALAQSSAFQNVLARARFDGPTNSNRFGSAKEMRSQVEMILGSSKHPQRRIAMTSLVVLLAVCIVFAGLRYQRSKQLAETSPSSSQPVFAESGTPESGQERTPHELIEAMDAQLNRGDPNSKSVLEHLANECQRRFHRDHPLVVYARANLAFVHRDSVASDSMATQRACVAKMMRHGEKNLMTLRAALRFAKSLSTSSDIDLLTECEGHAEFCLDGFRAHGETQDYTAALDTLAFALKSLSRGDEAIALLKSEIQQFEEQNTSPSAVNALRNSLSRLQ